MTDDNRQWTLRKLARNISLRVSVFVLLFRIPAWGIYHCAAAMLIGMNELTKMQIDLRQKVLCRALRASVQNAAVSIGLDVNHLPSFFGNKVVLEIEMPGSGIPLLEFRESDWELMRAALAEHDAKVNR
jgi:hypothetical protein